MAISNTCINACQIQVVVAVTNVLSQQAKESILDEHRAARDNAMQHASKNVYTYKF